MTRLVLFVTCFSFLLSCGDSPIAEKVEIQVKQSVIHPLYFQEELNTQLNFPFWFNDSLLREQGVRSIVWRTYRSEQLDEENKGKKTADLHIKVVYTFNEQGQLIGVERKEYNDGIRIARYRYALTPGAKGYSVVKPLQPLISEDEEINEPYVTLRMLRPRKRVAQYEDDLADQRYHYFFDGQFQGPLSVDSIGHPRSNDWVIIGKPNRPEKRYHVSNTVTESDVTRYVYLNDNYPHMIRWTDYPFTQSRHFRYTQKGAFVGYTDSTFVDQTFVTRTISSFEFDHKHRPIRIVHRKGHAAGEKSYRTIETIDYILFSSGDLPADSDE